MREIRIATNGFMMLFSVGMVVGLIRCAFTLQVLSFRVVATMLAVAVAYSLFKIVLGWRGRFHP